MRGLITCLFLSTFVFVSAAKAAVERSLQPVDAAQFGGMKFQQLAPNALIYNEAIGTFDEWTQQSPLDRQAVALYPGYAEPTVTAVKNGTRKQQIEKLMIFEARFKLNLNKAPGQINLANLIKLDTISRFDTEIKHQQIQPNQLMTAVAGKGQIGNFKWCNSGGTYISRPAREVDLSYANPKTRAWCSDTAHSICIESCYLFSAYWNELVKLANAPLEESDKKDYGIALQSEIRYFSTEQELGMPVPIAQLTGLNTPVRGGLEQSMFYFNQILEFGKIIAVLQDHPSDPTKTSVSVFFVIGIKKRTYNQFAEVKRALLGQSKLLGQGIVFKTGISAGLPIFTQNMVKSIANILEN